MYSQILTTRTIQNLLAFFIEFNVVIINRFFGRVKKKDQLSNGSTYSEKFMKFYDLRPVLCT